LPFDDGQGRNLEFVLDGLSERGMRGRLGRTKTQGVKSANVEVLKQA